MLKSLHTEIGKGGQSADYTELLTLGTTDRTHRLRVTIRSDAYAFQSFARIDRFDGTLWHPLGSIHHARMHTRTGLAYGRHALAEGDFAADRNALVNLARLILDIPMELPGTRPLGFEAWRKTGRDIDDPAEFERLTGVDQDGLTGRVYDGGAFLIRMPLKDGAPDGSAFVWDLPLCSDEFQCADRYPLECALWMYVYREQGGEL